MGKLYAALFMTLDGVVEAPGSGDTTLPDKRGWSEPFMTQEIGMAIMGQMDDAEAMLLGRNTYQDFAAFWPNVPAGDPFGDRMNNQKKYVVSSTLKRADWKNSTLINSNVAEEIARIKAQTSKTISVVGSGTLTQWLIEHDLLDELQLLVCPVYLGVGKKLFKDGNTTKTMKLLNSRAFSSGALLLNYQPLKA